MRISNKFEADMQKNASPVGGYLKKPAKCGAVANSGGVRASALDYAVRRQKYGS